MSLSGAPLTWMVSGAPGAVDAACTQHMNLCSDAKGTPPTRGCRSLYSLTSLMPIFMPMVSSATSVGYPMGSHAMGTLGFLWLRFLKMPASLQSTAPSNIFSMRATFSSGRSLLFSSCTTPTGEYPTPVILYCCVEVCISWTVISFLVSVPVLSEQITVTDPRVSTAGSCRMIALLFASICIASASEIVTTAGRPSGMIATAMATVDLKASPTVKSWMRYATQKEIAAMISTNNAIHLPNISSWTIRFVFCESTLETIAEILPISARSPVPHTTPLPCPVITIVAENAMFFRSPRADCGKQTSVILVMGFDSPVSIASRIPQLPVTSIMRRSAGQRSPAWMKHTSPGTTFFASINFRSPERITVALEESMPWIAAAACSARPSCTRPIVTLMTTTPPMRATSAQSCKMPATMAAAMRM
mmetsp:Transcript_22832/g.54592  ORF Transcript_22832/g.54592 Transcript_22832/m.54592 type:complete len:418 (+) Transcript_22832:1675-2928(+)